jgi:hypothetical protein
MDGECQSKDGFHDNNARTLYLQMELHGESSTLWMSTGPPFFVATIGNPCAAACSQQSTSLP